MSKNDDPVKVEIFNRINRLKEKAGGVLGKTMGRFSPTSLEKADLVIEEMADLYPQEIERRLKALNDEWARLKTIDDAAEKSKSVELMSNLSIQIKDLAGTFGYTLMSDFGDSLCQYILETEMSREEHSVIVQAHIDVMEIAFKQNLKSDGGKAGQELKETVKKAIEKYH